MEVIRPMSCPLGKCDGSGWLITEDDTAVPCECREKRHRRARSKGISTVIPKRFRGVSFDRPPVPELDEVVVREVKRYVSELDRRIEEGQGLWLMGDVGTGKTTLAMIVSKAALESGHSVAIYSLPRLLAEIRKTFDQDSDNTYLSLFKQLAGVDLLHIDDVGAERQTDWVLEQLYSLVNERYEQKKAVIITTNLGPNELRDQIGERTVSRLVEICDNPLPLRGVDLRMVYPAAKA